MMTIFIFGVIFYSSYKQIVFKNSIQKETKNQITNFKYDDGYSFENKNFFLSQYELGGDYCYSFKEYYMNGLFYKFSEVYNKTYQCHPTKIIDRDTISVYHDLSVVEKDYSVVSNKIGLSLFGVNNMDYEKFIITYVWGETFEIPISKEPLFFYYQLVDVPNEYLDSLNRNDYYTVIKI